MIEFMNMYINIPYFYTALANVQLREHVSIHVPSLTVLSRALTHSVEESNLTGDGELAWAHACTHDHNLY